MVDDGSSDRTAAEVLKYVEREGTDRLRLLVLPKNVGKGGAVKRVRRSTSVCVRCGERSLGTDARCSQGMMCGRGELLLMADADAATEISDFEKLERVLQELQHAEPPHMGVVVGSRAHLVNSDAVAKVRRERESAIHRCQSTSQCTHSLIQSRQRAWYRNLPMHVFHFLVDNLCVRGIRDTQCGFKLFSRAAARRIFPRQKIWGWSFDCELLFLAGDLPVAEVAVFWVDVPGSKLSVVLASLEMARDIVLLRVMYGLGLWR